MPLQNVSGVLISDDPEPGFPMTFRDWEVYVRRVRRLANPVDHAHGWMQTTIGTAIGTGAGLVMFPGVTKHHIRFPILLTLFFTSLVVTAFLWWFSKEEIKGRPETVESLCADMEAHGKAKALEQKQHTDPPMWPETE